MYVNNYLDLDLLETGDRLVRKKGGILSKHHAIFMGRDRATNQYIVAENQVGYGVRVIALQQFLNEGDLVRIEHNHFSFMKKDLIIKRINQRIGISYNLLGYNCEHFVNDVLHGKIISKQINNGLSVAGIAALGLLLRA